MMMVMMMGSEWWLGMVVISGGLLDLMNAAD